MSEAGEVEKIISVLAGLLKDKRMIPFLLGCACVAVIIFAFPNFDKVTAAAGGANTARVIMAILAISALALFSYSLYLNHHSSSNNTTDPIPHDKPKVIPSSYQSIFDSWKSSEVNNHCLYFPVEPFQYSKIAESIIIKQDDAAKIFTVANFEPIYFLDKVISKCRETNPSLFSSYAGKMTAATVDALLGNTATCTVLDDISNELFPHFKAISLKASSNTSHVIRILLVDDLSTNKTEWKRRNSAAMAFFLRLNGKADLFLGEKSRLLQQGIRMLTDHVIFDDKICLDYYEDSHYLVVIFDGLERSDQAASVMFKQFINHFHANTATCYFDANRYFA